MDRLQISQAGRHFSSDQPFCDISQNLRMAQVGRDHSGSSGWSFLWLTRFIYPKQYYIFDSYCGSVLDSVTICLSVLQRVICR